MEPRPFLVGDRNKFWLGFRLVPILDTFLAETQEEVRQGLQIQSSPGVLSPCQEFSRGGEGEAQRLSGTRVLRDVFSKSSMFLEARKVRLGISGNLWRRGFGSLGSFCHYRPSLVG